MLSYLENYTDEYLRASGLRFRPDLPIECPDLQVSSMIRHHIFCAIREALHNAVKYAGSCEVRLKVEVTKTFLKIELSDTGCGFDPESIPSRAGRHNGIINMQNRMKEIDGSFDLNTESGRGTRLRFQVSLM
jgi:signal transduction histidine kinase